MIDPAWGPFLFDTSAESWLSRSAADAAGAWFRAYLRHNSVNVSAVTVLERLRGYALLQCRTQEDRRPQIDASRHAYLRELGKVWPVYTAVAAISAEIMARLPDPPTPPRRAHLLVESRQERLVRWRFDVIIAATALVAALPLVHNNPADFEAIRNLIERSPEEFPGVGPLNLILCRRLHP